MREMRSSLASRICKNGVKRSASGAVSPDPQWSIPMFRIKNRRTFALFTSPSLRVYPPAQQIARFSHKTIRFSQVTFLRLAL